MPRKEDFINDMERLSVNKVPMSVLTGYLDARTSMLVNGAFPAQQGRMGAVFANEFTKSASTTTLKATPAMKRLR